MHFVCNNYYCQTNYIRSQVYDVYSAISVMCDVWYVMKLNKIEKMAS